MLQKSSRLKRTQVIAVTFLTIAGIVNYLDRSTLSIANHSVSEELNLSASQMGLLLSAFSLAYAFAQLPVGAMLDRFGFDGCVYSYEAEPSYLSFSRFFYAMGVLHQRLAPRAFKPVLFVFGRKTASA